MAGKTVQLLLALQEGPRHGYSIAQWVAKVDSMVRLVVLPDHTDAVNQSIPSTPFYCGKLISNHNVMH